MCQDPRVSSVLNFKSGICKLVAIYLLENLTLSKPTFWAKGDELCHHHPNV